MCNAKVLETKDLSPIKSVPLVEHNIKMGGDVKYVGLLFLGIELVY